MLKVEKSRKRRRRRNCLPGGKELQIRGKDRGRRKMLTPTIGEMSKQGGRRTSEEAEKKGRRGRDSL